MYALVLLCTKRINNCKTEVKVEEVLSGAAIARSNIDLALSQCCHCIYDKKFWQLQMKKLQEQLEKEKKLIEEAKENLMPS